MAAPASWRLTGRQWPTLAVLTVPVAGAFLLLDLALDPALLDGMWRTGRTTNLLLFLGVAFFCGVGASYELHLPKSRLEHALTLLGVALGGAFFAIISLVLFNFGPRLPNLRLLSLAVLGFSCVVLAHLSFIWSLAVALRVAHVRHRQDAVPGGPARPDYPALVGLEFVRGVISVLWSVVVLAVTGYAAAIAQMRSVDPPALLRAAILLGAVYVTALGALGWMVHRVQQDARTTGDEILLARVQSWRERFLAPAPPRAAPLAPDLKIRWPIVLATGLGLAALSLLAFVVLDGYVVHGIVSGRQSSWALWLGGPFFCLMGLVQASARRYPRRRYRRLLFAAGAFVLAGDALLLDRTHPVHAIVPAPALLSLSGLFALVGVLTCRALVLSRHSAGDALHRPRHRRDPLFLLVSMVVPLPLLIVLAHLFAYGAPPVQQDWAALAYVGAPMLMMLCLVADPRALLSPTAAPPAPPAP
jgi:hypothetical protein